MKQLNNLIKIIQFIYLFILHILKHDTKKKQVITSARALSVHPTSKIAKDNVEVFADMWQWLCSDITLISKEVLDLAQNRPKPDKHEYLSLPRPGVSI